MQVAIDAPKRPALKYYGGKWNLAPWIIGFFPEHKGYVEPCGGGASVLLQKPRALIETYNDLDGNVVNFFRVLRDRPDELAHKIRLTPWAREEYDLAFWHTDEGDDVERARRFFIAQWMGINASTQRSASTYGWRVESTTLRGRLPNDIDLFHSELIEQFVGRFKYVQIENLPALEVIAKYDTPDTLIYFDPPYVMTDQRTKADWYAYDWKDEDHAAPAEMLHAAQGFAVVSGYACPLYADLYEAHGWRRVDRQAYGQQGIGRVESLWLSPRTWAALNDEMSGLPLFN